jgi:hypothetical protein
MAVSILRWKGGSGGDMLLYIKSLSHPGSVVNVAYQQLDATGKIDCASGNLSNLKEINKMALNPYWLEQINKGKLLQEITLYSQQAESVWLKSHYYDTDIFNSYTLDLVADASTLPFVILSNLIKTDTLARNFTNLDTLIKDDYIRYKYYMYLVGTNCLKDTSNLNTQKIPVSSLLVDLKTFTQAVSKTNLDLDPDFFHIYENWLSANKKHLPCLKYYDKVLSQDFDFMDTDLSLPERYSLLVLSGNKFVNLC